MSKNKDIEKDAIESEIAAERKVNSFLATHIRPILWTSIAVIIILAIIGIYEANSNKTSVADFNKLYDAQIALSQAVAADKDTDSYEANVQAALDGVIALEDSKDYVGNKAKLVVANQYFADEKYQEALDLYNEVYAEVADKNYIGSIALSSAAATEEQLGNDDKALELSQTLLDTFGNLSAESAKAMFTIGRIYEKQGKNDLAKAQFQQLADQFPQSEYGKLAKNSLLRF